MNFEKEHNNISDLKEMIEKSLKGNSTTSKERSIHSSNVGYKNNKEVINDRDMYIGIDNFTANGILIK